MKKKKKKTFETAFKPIRKMTIRTNGNRVQSKIYILILNSTYTGCSDNFREKSSLTIE